MQVQDKTAVSRSNTIKSVLELLKLRNKLIVHTSDGATVMSGNVHGIQTLMKETYPNAHFVRWYAHQLNLTLLCSARVSILRVFFPDLTSIATFFSGSQTQVAALTEATQRCIPRPPDAWWNCKSRTVQAVGEKGAACIEDMRTQSRWDGRPPSVRHMGFPKSLRTPPSYNFSNSSPCSCQRWMFCTKFCKNRPLMQLESAVFLFGSKQMLKI